MKDLTSKEQEFMIEFLKANGCGAESSKELLSDNYSCQCIEDLQDEYPDLTANQIGGFLSSLQEKGAIQIEEDRGTEFNPLSQKVEKLANLYWVTDGWLDKNIDLKW